jgi:cell division protease FtsH
MPHAAGRAAGEDIGAVLQRSRYRGGPVAWDDVVGHGPAKRELAVVAAQVRRQSAAERLGLTLVSGVLISGPAGSGKTLLAKALASAVDRPVYVLPSAEATPSMIREVYEALADQPSIAVWDESDVILRRRGRPGSADEGRLAAAFCGSLSGAMPLSGPITVCLTAAGLWSLDPSALRAGRLTTHVELGLPDRAERLELWRMYTSRVPSEGPLDLDRAADRSVGMTGADIEAIVAVALGLSLVDGSDALRQPLLDEAVLRRHSVDEQPPRPDALVRRAAVHESGHAVYAALTWGPRSLASVTARRAGGEGGRTDLDDGFFDGTELDLRLIRERAAWCLAGLVAEELVYGPTATSGGSSHDLAQATRVLRRLVADLGASATVGPVCVSGVEAGADSDRGSEAMRSSVWAEIRAESIAALAAAKAALGPRRGDIERLAGTLHAAVDLTLSGDRLQEALGAIPTAGDEARPAPSDPTRHGLGAAGTEGASDET